MIPVLTTPSFTHAQPAGQSDFWAAVFFFLLWLPGLVLSLRLPLLLLLQLW